MICYRSVNDEVIESLQLPASTKKDGSHISKMDWMLDASHNEILITPISTTVLFPTEVSNAAIHPG